MDIQNQTRRVVELSLKLGTLMLLVVWSFKIIQPMLLIGVWGTIIAIGAYPAYTRLIKIFRGREALAAVSMCLGLILVLLLPVGMLTANAAKSLEGLAGLLEAGKVVIPPPGEELKEMPVIGENLYEAWYMASTNMMELVKYALPHVKSMAPKVLAFAGNMGVSVFQTIISIVMAGIFLLYGRGAGRVSEKVSKVLLGDYISDFTGLAAGTIRSVVQGIIGVGVIQGLAAGIGLSLAGVPGAGIWTVLTIFICVVQLPPMIVLGPVAVYLFVTGSLLTAVLFSIWVLVITFGDTPLRAMLFGRGLEVPSLVIFVGTMGGVLNWGIVGLFVGAVVLALGYKFAETLIATEIGEEEQAQKKGRETERE